ncbi:MAG: ATP-binding cassette domain-containing protein [Planctomycetes bacterium]|nr:ATP-binding cassette domain-containing protein [Planctomycetota bacterium]
MINVNNIIKRYGYVKALNDISFQVERGEILGFLGPNGAGKSTTMKILTGIISQDSGTVSVADHDISQNPLEVQKRIGYLPESNPLYYDMRVTDFLKFAAQMRRISSKDMTSVINNIVDSCNIGSVMYKNISELSKGFKQRVGLAQALLGSPEILILDEPTSGLDPKQIMEIRDLIKQLGKEKTVILSTHILQEVEATCTRVIIINEGKIVTSGSIEDLRRNLKGGEAVYASIRGDENAVIARLQENHNISAIDVINRFNDGITSYRITPVTGKDIREDVFHIIAKNGLALTELRRDALKLEEIFIKLTAKENS